MNHELLRLIHNECTPEERLATLGRIQEDPDLKREYHSLLDFDAELKSMFADAARERPQSASKKSASVLSFTKIIGGFTAIAATLVVSLIVFKTPNTDTHIEHTLATANAPIPTSEKDPFAQKGRYVAEKSHKLTPAEIAMARQLANSEIIVSLEIQSRASAKMKIKEMISKPYIPKIGRDLKLQSTNQEVIEMLLADKHENSDSSLVFVPTLY